MLTLDLDVPKSNPSNECEYCCHGKSYKRTIFGLMALP